MRLHRILAACALASPLLAGCSGTPAAPTVQQLTGSWRLVSIQPLGQGEQATPAGAAYLATFTADGRVSIRADCNTCSGAFTLSGQTLTAPTLICTRAACPTMPFENLYTQLFTGESTVAISAGALMLSSRRGVLRFTK